MTSNSPRALLPVVVVFVVLLGALWFGFGQAIKHRQYPNRGLADSTAGPVVLAAGRDGHFRAPGSINGMSVQFLIDTGASTVAIPGKVAQRLGISRGPQVRVQTAAGPTTAYLTRLETVAIGAIAQHGVGAVIIPDMRQGSVLLGMSFLDNVTLIKRDDQLVLKQPQ